MKKLLMLLMVGLATVSFSATFKENRQAIIDCADFTTAVAYYNALPAVEQSDILVEIILNKDMLYLKPSLAQTYLDFIATLPEDYITHKKAAALLIIGNTNACLAEVASAMEAEISPRSRYHDVDQWRAIFLIYTHKLVNSNIYTDEQIANKCAELLLGYQHHINATSKGLLLVWNKYGKFCTSHTVQQVYWKLENENKPVLRTPEEALWWGLNVTSKVN
jgi:hypothetical protein